MPNAVFDPGKIKSPYGVLAAFLLVLQAILIYWLAVAGSPWERIAAGVVLTANAAFFFVATLKVARMPVSEVSTDIELARKLCGRWVYSSEAASGETASGECTISLRGGELNLSGTYRLDGALVGTWIAEMTRLRESRILFYYMLRETTAGHGLTDAVSVLLFDPENLSEMLGDWIVVGKEKRQGSVRFSRTP